MTRRVSRLCRLFNTLCLFNSGCWHVYMHHLNSQALYRSLLFPLITHYSGNRRPTFSETKRVMRILLSVYEPSSATLAAFAPQPKLSKRSTAATVGVLDAAAVQTVPVVAEEAKPQIEASRLHRAAAAGDADKVCQNCLYCVCSSILWHRTLPYWCMCRKKANAATQKGSGPRADEQELIHCALTLSYDL